MKFFLQQTKNGNQSGNVSTGDDFVEFIAHSDIVFCLWMVFVALMNI